jgi:hypothetical protein
MDLYGRDAITAHVTMSELIGRSRRILGNGNSNGDDSDKD